MPKDQMFTVYLRTIIYDVMQIGPKIDPVPPVI